MSDPRQLLSDLVRTAFGRRAPVDDARGRHGGEGPRRAEEALEHSGPAAAAAAPARTPSASQGAGGNAEPSGRAALDRALAAKLLQQHLQSRHQLLDPPPWEFRDLDRGQAELLVRSMIAAAYADGRLDAHEQESLQRALEMVGSSEAEQRFLQAALDERQALDTLLAEVGDLQMAARFYAAALLAVDARKPVNRSYLNYLANRLELPTEILIRLHRQFGVFD